MVMLLLFCDRARKNWWFQNSCEFLRNVMFISPYRFAEKLGLAVWPWWLHRPLRAQAESYSLDTRREFTYVNSKKAVWWR